MPMVLAAVTYACRPRRWPRNSTPSSDSEVPIIPAVGTKVAISGDEGSFSVTDSSVGMAEFFHPLARDGIVLDDVRCQPPSDQRRRGGCHHLGSATHQDLAITPVAVPRDDVGK